MIYRCHRCARIITPDDDQPYIVQIVVGPVNSGTDAVFPDESVPAFARSILEMRDQRVTYCVECADEVIDMEEDEVERFLGVAEKQGRLHPKIGQRIRKDHQKKTAARMQRRLARKPTTE